MRNELHDHPDPARPALIVTYGNTSRKYRPLERDIVVVGRAPGCDVALASPEVAPIHCILSRGPHGWHVRDCSGRGGTRVNGTTVVDSPMKHGDSLQVGTFSFEAHLPGVTPNASPPVAAIASPAAPAETDAEELPAVEPTEEETRKQDIRARELALYAEYLRRHEQEVNARLSARHEELARAETTVREQRAELVRRMTEMARAGQAPRTKSDSASRQDAEALRTQLAMLRQELAGRDSIIAGLRVRLERMERDLASRGSLEHERDELALQREALSEQVAQLEERRADLEEAKREAELQSAHERAQMARDRSELERLLDDFRFEQESVRRKLEAIGGTGIAEPVTEEMPHPSPLKRPVVRTSGSHPNASKWLDFPGPDATD